MRIGFMLYSKERVDQMNRILYRTDRPKLNTTLDNTIHRMLQILEWTVQLCSPYTRYIFHEIMLSNPWCKLGYDGIVERTRRLKIYDRYTWFTDDSI